MKALAPRRYRPTSGRKLGQLKRSFELHDRRRSDAAARMSAKKRQDLVSWVRDNLVRRDLRNVSRSERVALGYELRWFVRAFSGPSVPQAMWVSRSRMKPLADVQLFRVQRIIS